MTTAHRPTWAPAKGHEEQGGSRAFGPSKQYSSRDLASHTTLKYRSGFGESGSSSGSGSDLKAALLQRERLAMRKRMAGMSGKDVDEYDEEVMLQQRLAIEEKLRPNEEDKDFEEDDDEDNEEVHTAGGRGRRAKGGGDGDGVDIDRGGGGGGGGGMGRSTRYNEDEENIDDDDDDSDDDSDDDDDEDDTAALLAELEKIKKERAMKAAAAKEAEAAAEEKRMEGELMTGNPLLNIDSRNGRDNGTDTNSSAQFGIKRRWDDDVVFRNQARDEPKKQKRFINDTIRNDFHRRFLNKYIL